MADRHAALPFFGPRLMGSSQHAYTRPHRARVVCEHKGMMILLHAFIKKTQKTPPSDVALALKRMKEVL